MAKVNTALLYNFLQGLALSKILLKRVLLQLGAEYYGLDLGPTLAPLEETDKKYHLLRSAIPFLFDSPVLPESNFYYTQEDNFYYTQEDFLGDHVHSDTRHWIEHRISALNL